MKRAVLMICAALAAVAAYASPVFTQSFETPSGDGWFIDLGPNSSYTRINDGTAADGDHFLRFTIGPNEFDGNNNLIDFSVAAVFDQFVWPLEIPLRFIESTMQVRGEFSSYMVYQVVPNPSDLTNQFFVIGGGLTSPLSQTEWTVFSAGQGDLFHVEDFLGNLYQTPAATPGNPLTLAAISQLPILLQADGSDTGMVWGDALVRWVTPHAGLGSGFDPPRTTDLDDLRVFVIPEPATVFLLGFAGILLGRKYFRKQS